jgi:hypothetical protein
MTETIQGLEAIILNHKRRLQILKEKAAQFGISTPPEILTEIEDIESKLKELEQTQKIDDPFLALLLAIGIITINYVHITLTVNGVIVSGYIIGAKQYGEYLLNNTVTVIEGSKLGVNSEVIDHANKTYLHLRDARLYPTNGGPIPPLNEPGMYWRGKLSAIESYAIGITNP